MHIPRQWLGLPVLLAGLIPAISGISCAVLHPRALPVTLSEADLQHANQALSEGDAAFNKKDYYAALIKYLEAARYNPDSTIVVNRLGIAYTQLKLYDEARETLERLTKRHPKFSYGFNNLGSVYFLQMRLNKAEKYFRKAIHLKDNEPSFHINLGNLYLEKKKTQKALSEWRKALSIDPLALSRSNAVNLTSTGRTSPAERNYLMARLYASDKKVELAIESLKQAFANGFSNIAAIEKDSSFDPIRQDPRFIEFSQNISLLIRLRDKVGLPENNTEPLPTK